MRNIILFFSLSFSCFIFGQQTKKTDSLKTVLLNVKNDNQRLEVLNSILLEYLLISLDSAKVYKDKVIKLSNRIENKDLAIKGYNGSSNYFYYNSEIDSSLFYVKKALSLLNNSDNYKLQSDLYRKLAILSVTKSDFKNYEKYSQLALKQAILANDWTLQSSALVVIGNQYYRKNDYSNALKYYIKIDSLHSANDSITRNLSIAYENISLIYIDLKNEKAIEYLDKSQEVHEKMKNEVGINNTDRLRANYYNKIEDTEKTIFYLNKVLPFYESYGEPTKLVEVYTELARYYSYIGEFDKAEPLLKKTKLITDNNSNRISENQMQYSYGVFYLRKKMFNEAIEYFNAAQTTAPPNGTEYYLGERKEISEGLSEAYAGIKDYKMAYDINKRLLSLNDSINIQNKKKITFELETKYQTEKKEQEIALLKSQKELAEQQKKSQRNLYMGGMGITTLVGIFLFVLYRNRQKTNKKLKKLDKAKSHFFSNISHELRTPLTLISGPIQNKLDDKNLTDKDRSDFELVLNNSNRISELVNQLLDISKIEAGSMTLSLQKVHPMQQINAIIKDFEYATSLKNINFLTYINNHEEEGWLDRDAVHKIITNLVSNAIKYTPENGSIIFNAHIKKHKLFIDIKNTGDGLTKEQRQLVFKRFYQTHSEQSGSGVGLALVNELIKLHEGNITVDSRLNEWTSFNLSISLDKKSIKNAKVIEDNTNIDNTSPYQNHYEVTNTSSNKTDTDHTNEELPIALIVEDNKDLNHLLQENFKNHYKVISAQDGLEGYELALQYIPDIIISDIMMPKKDGIELTNELKNDERTSHIPIILLTAKAGEENELSGLQIGADEYITKPFNQKILTTKASNLITIRKKLQLRYSQEVILTPKDIAITPIDENFLNKVQKVLDKQLIESSFSVEEFSKAIGMSRMQLHRKLKALTGLTSSEFVRSQRLKLAAQLLQSSDTNISQVGYAVGFNDHSYFTKCFKEMYACTPTEYAIKDS
ncbi:hybrid sensor histidine kinase/response regulator transcription factor [Aquimarina algiphila]|uniref:hybrid sensor histidine kinase/response regulator transcription factor n=1 Tax=Aquimarina algiphila TaxID=2047982 RepID=UPI00232CC836|nr:response regulator [Aquimarina algiphila]